MQRIELNIHEKELCVKLVIYKDYTEQDSCSTVNRLKYSGYCMYHQVYS
jgi:hypothetical protein